MDVRWQLRIKASSRAFRAIEEVAWKRLTWSIEACRREARKLIFHPVTTNHCRLSSAEDPERISVGFEHLATIQRDGARHHIGDWAWEAPPDATG